MKRMSNSYFSLKRFTIHQDRCAMKVGTDGVLLGAWAPIEGVRRILDVGTGTGVIALQLAQRCAEATLTAIEIDKDAAAQASDNVNRSPWANRIEVICCDFRDFYPEEKFDLIVSNPPYFVDALRCPDTQRNLARHTDSLNYELLFSRSKDILETTGQIAVVIPGDMEKNVIDAAWKNKLYPQHCTKVYTKPGKPYKRILLTFGSRLSMCREDTLYIEDAHHRYTPEYEALTRDFYLKM